MEDESKFFNVTIDQKPKHKKNTKVSSTISVSLVVGMCIGFVICLSVVGIGQQLYNSYTDLFYSDNFVSYVRFIWMNVDWRIWTTVIFLTIIVSAFVIGKIKRKIRDI